MKILIITEFFPPLNSIASHRPYSWAKYWSSQGYKVTVLTTKKQVDNADKMIKNNDGFELIEIAVPFKRYSKKKESKRIASKKKGGFLSPIKRLVRHLAKKYGILSSCRMPDLTDLWIKPALKEVVLKPWDLVFSTSGPYTTHLLAMKLRENGVVHKWVADFQDLWVKNPVYPGFFPFTIFEWFLEKKVIAKADKAVTVSLHFAKILEKRHHLKKVDVIMNGFEPTDRQGLNSEYFFEKADKWRIAYTGAIYAGKQNIEPLFQAVSDLKSYNHSFIQRLELVFAGPTKEYITQLAQKYDILEYVNHHGMLSHEEALRIQRDVHMLCFLEWTSDGVPTGQVFEYISSKTPIMILGDGIRDGGKIILEAQAGHLFSDFNEISTFLSHEIKGLEKESLCPNDAILKKYERKHLAEEFLNSVLRSVDSS